VIQKLEKIVLSDHVKKAKWGIDSWQITTSKEGGNDQTKQKWPQLN
jgi:hypothetical protein